MTKRGNDDRVVSRHFSSFLFLSYFSLGFISSSSRDYVCLCVPLLMGYPVSWADVEIYSLEKKKLIPPLLSFFGTSQQQQQQQQNQREKSVNHNQNSARISSLFFLFLVCPVGIYLYVCVCVCMYITYITITAGPPWSFIIGVMMIRCS